MTKVLRILVLSLVAASPVVTVHGQQPPTYRYMARVEPVTPGQSPKPLFAAINALAPESLFGLDQENKVLRLDTQRELTLVELQSASATTGFIVLSLERYDRITGERHAQQVPGSDVFPMFIDTGDERADHARYDAAKAAWIGANPDEYVRMTQGTSTATKVTADEE